MTRRVIAVLAVLAGCAAFRADSHAAPAGVPVLVELFTSEGCSSCPPADRVFERMLASQPAAGAVIVGLGEHVDYWDQQGWKDRFSSAQFTRRQQGYADRLHDDSVYTPQMIVDGEAAFVGSDVDALRRAIAAAVGRPHGVLRLSVDSNGRDRLSAAATIDRLPAGADARADLLVAVTEDHLRSDVKRGENRGRTLTHAVVVRELRSLGDAAVGRTARADITVPDEWNRDALSVVAFVQERRSRRVLATAAWRP